MTPILSSCRRRVLMAATCSALLVTSSLPVRAAPSSSQEVADLVVLNGKVFTADARSSLQEAFAIKDQKFIAVGSSREIRRHIGPNTRVIDLEKNFVSPGLTDDHFHNEGGGPGIDLSHVRTLSELLAVIASAAKAAPPGRLLISNSDWHEAQLKEQRLPTATELSAVAPDNPVVLVRGGHSLILNGKALERWHITPETSIPAGGGISRDATGQLTGEIFDNAKRLVDLPPPQQVTMQDVLTTQKVLNAYGITSVRIPGAYKGDLVEAYVLMKKAAASGSLSLRYTVYIPGFTLRSAGQVDELIKKWGVRLDEGDEWVRIGGIKLGVDGGFEGGHLSRPYLEPYGKGGTYSGVTTSPPEAYNEVVAQINRLGWRATTHVVGDAGLDQVLAAYEAADRERPLAGRRWAVEHVFLANREQLARLKKLDVAVSAQDHLYLAAPALKKYWGWDYASEVTPIKSFLDAGLLVAGGTDSPVVPFNPFFVLYHFMSRDTISDGIYGADQKIGSRPLVLELITSHYAQLIGESATRGSIEPGKLADFAVLSADIMTAPAETVRDMKALATFVGGREVWARARGRVTGGIEVITK
jgi:predicted amidohydrolase YtcJ